MELRVFHVDAFTDIPFGGNPAGVVLDSKDLTTEIMQKIANELSLSETAFISQRGEDRFHIRFFTPVCEVDLCGHATIASFFTLSKQGYIKPIESGMKKVTLITNNNKLNIDIEYEENQPVNITMEQNIPRSYGILSSLDEIIYISNLKLNDIGFKDQMLLPEIISTGLKDLILPIKTKEALDNLEFDMCELMELSKKLDIVGVHAIYLPEKDSEEIYVRNFAPIVGIDEESATGTANGAMIYYLKIHKLINRNEMIAHQGESLNRLSQIYCQIQKEEDAYKVKVGGKANITMESILKCKNSVL